MSPKQDSLSIIPVTSSFATCENMSQTRLDSFSTKMHYQLYNHFLSDIHPIQSSLKKTTLSVIACNRLKHMFSHCSQVLLLTRLLFQFYQIPLLHFSALLAIHFCNRTYCQRQKLQEWWEIYPIRCYQNHFRITPQAPHMET